MGLTGSELSLGTTMLLVTLVVWSLVWKGIGLWYSGKRGHVVWFVAILLLNTFGILPLIYLSITKKKKRKMKKNEK